MFMRDAVPQRRRTRDQSGDEVLVISLLAPVDGEYRIERGPSGELQVWQTRAPFDAGQMQDAANIGTNAARKAAAVIARNRAYEQRVRQRFGWT